MANVVVDVQLSGADSPSGIPVRLRSGGFSGAGVLDDRGQARLALIDDQRQPVAESAAWNHDWEADRGHGRAPTSTNRRRHASGFEISRGRGWRRLLATRSSPRSSPPNPTTELRRSCGVHRLADLFEPFGGRALALFVLLLD